MSRSFCQVNIIGRLGKDPEMRYANNGNAVANLSVATSKSWKDKTTGEKKEKTEWHKVVVFGKLAEIAGQYAKKGTQVFLQGELQTRKWSGQDGVERWTTEVVVDQFGTFMLLDNKGNNGSFGQQQEGQQPMQQQAQQPMQQQPMQQQAQQPMQQQPMQQQTQQPMQQQPMQQQTQQPMQQQPMQQQAQQPMQQQPVAGVFGAGAHLEDSDVPF